MSIGVHTAQQDSFIVILNFLKHICIVFKIHISFMLDRNLQTFVFRVGTIHYQSTYVLCGYSVRQRIYCIYIPYIVCSGKFYNIT